MAKRTEVTKKKYTAVKGHIRIINGKEVRWRPHIRKIGVTFLET
jgi:hypothetical protein